MPFVADDLTLVSKSPTSGASLFTYRTADTAAVVQVTNYFNSAVDRFILGDVIIATVGVGGTLGVQIYFVNSVTVGAVDVTNGLAVTATDSD